MFVAPIPVGARLVDCVTILTPATALALKAQGVDGVIRYYETLGPAEVDAIMAANLGLCPVGYSRRPGWVPKPGDGVADATGMLAKLTALALPLGGLHQWCDLEGCAGSLDQASAFLEEHSKTIVLAGGRGGVYVGAEQPLGAKALYDVVHVTAYWRSQSADIPEPRCGWVMVQLYPTTTCGGVSVDFDFAQQDYEGRRASWLR